MIARIWRGWAKPERADQYQALLTGEVIPQIVALKISGFQSYEILRRDVGAEVEFTTILRFDHERSIEGFIGAGCTRAHVPAEAQAVLDRWDDHAVHAECLERVELG